MYYVMDVNEKKRKIKGELVSMQQIKWNYTSIAIYQHTFNQKIVILSNIENIERIISFGVK